MKGFTSEWLRDFESKGGKPLPEPTYQKEKKARTEPRQAAIRANVEPWPWFVVAVESMGIPSPVFEYRFHQTRRWRFDMAWPAAGLALEVEGGVWVQGRHTRGKGFVNDIEKYNAAARLGWCVLRALPAWVDNLSTPEAAELLDTIKDRYEMGAYWLRGAATCSTGNGGSTPPASTKGAG